MHTGKVVLNSTHDSFCLWLQETLYELLGLSNEPEVEKWISRNNWKSDAQAGYVLVCSQDESIKTKKITEKIDLESVAQIMASAIWIQNTRAFPGPAKNVRSHAWMILRDLFWFRWIKIYIFLFQQRSLDVSLDFVTLIKLIAKKWDAYSQILNYETSFGNFLKTVFIHI